MKIVKVQYTIKPAFVAINKVNIAAIAKEVEALNHRGIKYGAFLMPDGMTFMHLDQFENEAAHQLLTSLKSFKKFDADLWGNGFEVEPKLELLSFVASV